MKRKLTFLMLFMTLCSMFSFGQNHWIPDTYAYNSTMTGDVIVYIDGIEQRTADLEVGAFCVDELRGSNKLRYTNIIPLGVDIYNAPLTIYGESGNEITFKLYDHNKKQVLDLLCSNKLNFSENYKFGEITSPYVINFITPVAEVNGTVYVSLDAAIAAANASDDVKLLGNVTLTQTLVIEEAININLNGNEINGEVELAIVGATITGTAENMNVVSGVENYVVNFDETSQTYSLVERSASGTIAYRAYIADETDREAVKVDLQNVYATKFVVVKLYDAQGNPLTTTSLKAGAANYPEYLTCNIVLSGTPSNSWNTTINAEKLTVDNYPYKAELWIDDINTHTFENILGNATDAAEYQLPAYLALDCVYKAASIVRNDAILDYYATFAEAYNAAQANDEIVLHDNVLLTGKQTITKAITINGNDKYSIKADENATWYTVSGSLNIKNYNIHLLGLNSDNITLKNVVLDCNNNAAGINLYCAQDIVFDNVQIINATKGFAALTVNGSTLTTKNNFAALGNGIAIDISNGSGVTSTLGFNVEEGTVFSLDNKTVKFGNNADVSSMTNAVDTNGNPYFAAKDNAYFYTAAQIESRTTAYSNGLTLLADVTLADGKTIKFKGTLDLNGHTLNAKLEVNGDATITGEGEIIAEIYLPSGKTLTAKEGLNVTTDEGAFVVYANGTYTSTQAVAKIGDTYYASLAEAIAAVGAGDVVIELLADVTFDYNARDAYGTAATTSLTIKGNNKTLTLNQTNSDWSSFGLANADAKVVFNNMIIEKTGYGDTSGAWNTHTIIFSSEVEMNKVTVNNSMAVQDGATLNNVTINEANGYYGLWINGNGQSVTMNGGAINATNGGRGIKIADQYVDAPAEVTLNVTGTTFNTAKKAAVLVSSTAGANITASNVNIENVAEDKINFAWVDEDWAAHYGEVTVTGGTLAQESVEIFNVTITDNNNAIQGYYKNIATAIADAQADETVNLLNDIEETSVIEINKDVTINGNDKTLTSSANRIFLVTASDIDVTINNLNMESTAVREGTNDIRGISISPSLENVTLALNDCSVYFTDLSATDWSYAVNVSGNGTGHSVTVNGGTYEGANVVNVHGANNTIVVNGAALTSLYPNNDIYTGATIWVLQENGSSVIATDNTFNGGNAVAFKIGTGTNLTQSNNTDNTTVVVAKVDETYYTSVNTAINEATNGATVQLLSRTISEAIAPWTGDSQHNSEKSITILGYTNGEFKTTLTGGMYLGYEDSQCRDHNIVVKNINFEGKGLKVACQKYVTIEGNNFNNITDSRAIAVIGKDINATVKGNEIDGVEIGIELRNMAVATMEGNVVKNTTHNSVQVTAANPDADVIITGNTFENWANTGGEGRAIRVSGGDNIFVNKNKMVNYNAPESFVKITKLGETVQEIDASQNYWSGNNPLTLFETDGANDPVSYLVNYYEDAEMQNLVALSASIAKVGNEYYQSLQAAVDAADENNNTVTLLTDATGAGVVIDKDVTIDFGGYTYTFNEGVGSAGTESNGFQILQDNNVTLKNGTLTSTAAVEGSKEIKMLIQNYANLTLTDMNLVDATEHIQYVLSNNSGNVIIDGTTSITTDAVAFDVYDYSAAGYTVPTVNVETEGIIEGEIEVSETATLNISGGTFTVEIAEAWCAEGFIPKDNGNGTYGVEPGVFVARVNGKGYTTIDAAFEAAQANDVVTILAGEYTQNLNISKPITVEGERDENGVNLVNITGKLNITADGATALNLNVNNGSETAVYINAKDVTVDGCTVVGKNGLYQSYTTGNVTFKNSTITGSTYGIHFDGNAGGNIVIENCDITGWTSFASTITNVAISNTEFLNGNYNQLRFYQNAQMTDCKFNENMTIDFGKKDVDATLNGCVVTDLEGNETTAPLTDVIYLGDIAEMGVDVTIDNETVVVESRITRLNEQEHRYFLKLTDALADVKDGETITLFADINEAVNVPVLEKTITFDGNNFTMTAGMRVGTDVNKLDEGEITVQNLNFANANAKADNGLSLVELKRVVVNNCTFTNITGDAIAVLSDNLTEEIIIINNVIDGATGAGINLRTPKAATVNDNVIKNVGGNAMTFQHDSDNYDASGNIVIEGNLMENWANNASEGRAIRLATGTKEREITINGNAMVKTDAPEEFVKITTAEGAQATISIDENYWNGQSPLNENVYLAEGVYPMNYYGGYSYTNETLTLSDLITFEYVAQVGDDKFTSLTDAIAAATTSNAVILLSDVTLSEILVIEKGVQINADGHTLTSTADRAININTTEVVVINDLTIATTNNTERAINVIQKAANLTLNNVTAEGFKYTINVASSSKGSTITTDGGKFSGYAAVNIAGNNTTFTANNTEFVGVNNYAQHETNAYAVIAVNNFADGIKVNINGGKLTATTINNRQFIVTAYDVTNTEITINAELVLANGDVFNGDVNNVTAKFQAQYADELNAQGYAVSATDADGLVTVMEPIAIVDGTYYATLQDAVNAVQEGETVTLLTNATGAGVVINKDVTIDFGGYTYTFNEGVGSAGTETLGFQILQGNDVVLKSGTLTSTAAVEGSKEIKMLIQNYANLTLTDMNLVDATEHIQYVLSNNSGEVNINGNTNITTDAVAFDVYDYSTAGYAVPTVNVETTGIIAGAIEVSETATLNIYDGSFTATIAEAWCAEGYIPTTEVIDGVTYNTVKKGKYIAQTETGDKFETLQAAVNAGTTVTLLTDATGAGVVIDKDVTIDFGGYTYTFNEGVGSAGTESNGFQILQDNNVTLKNGTLTSTAAVEGSKEIKMLIQNYANLTLTDMNFVDATEHIQYVLSNNSGNVIIDGTTNITTDAVAFDVYDYSTAGYRVPVVYVSTTGLIEGMIEVSSTIPTNLNISGGLFEMEIIEDWCAEFFSPVYNMEQGYWTVELTGGVLSRDFNENWNWFSSYIDLSQSDYSGLEKLQNALGTSGIQIKGQVNEIANYEVIGEDPETDEDVYAWTGRPFAPSNSKMYMIRTSEVIAAKDFIIKGEYLDHNHVPMMLKTGWNWISYPVKEAVDINNALVDLTPEVGDMIKSYDQGFAYYVVTEKYEGWDGNLSTMQPGQGYMYQSKKAGTKYFYYNVPEDNNRASLKANVTAENNHWIPTSKYANNMTMIAMLNIDGEMAGDNYEVAAFVNGECRGSARPIYVESMDAYMLFMTIYGEEVENLSFRYYDLNYGAEYELSETVVYSIDAIVGSLEEPYMFNLDILGVDEASVDDINIYPNPTTTIAEINLNATCDKVEVFNALGVKVAEYANVDTIDAIETAGVYMIRVTNNGEVKNCRLVVK